MGNKAGAGGRDGHHHEDSQMHSKESRIPLRSSVHYPWNDGEVDEGAYSNLGQSNSALIPFYNGFSGKIAFEEKIL